MDEPRGAMRFTINKSFANFDAFVEEYVANVSESGAFIRCNEVPDIGEQIAVSFTIVSSEVHEVSATAKVVRHTKTPPGIGVEFISFDGQSQQILQALVAQAHDTNKQ